MALFLIWQKQRLKQSIILDLCVAILEDILRQFYLANFQEEDVLEGLLIACESLTTYCILLEGVILSNGAPGLAQAMRIVIAHLSDINEQLEGWLERVQARNRDTGSRRGRPKMVITEDQLIQLLNSHFSVPDISRMLQCSRRTIYRRIQEFGLSNSLHSVVSDSDLDLIQCHPMSGHRILLLATSDHLISASQDKEQGTVLFVWIPLEWQIDFGNLYQGISHS